MAEPDPAVAAVKTYNYLRIALAALVLLLYTSVVLEWWAAGRCLQTSISDYYYTPVHAVFIGVLVTMGICLVSLKGNTIEVSGRLVRIENLTLAAGEDGWPSLTATVGAAAYVVPEATLAQSTAGAAQTSTTTTTTTTTAQAAGPTNDQ